MLRLALMDEGLQSAWVKLKRANLHAGVARREARRFYARHPEPTLKIEPVGESDHAVGSHFTIRLVVDHGWPDLPEHFSARFGDAIHNYRSALDHVAWELVCKGATPPETLADDNARRRIQWPSYDIEKTFRKKVHGRLPGVAKTALDFIHSRHQYLGGNATNDALTSLYDLSNEDKHKSLIDIRPRFLSVKHQVAFDRCRMVGYEGPEGRPAPKKDAVVLTIECVVTDANPHVSMQTQPTFHIALEDGRGFGDVLEGIRVEVTKILKAPEIRTATRQQRRSRP
jgi:hypothetical protein